MPNYPASLPDYATKKFANGVTDCSETNFNYWFAELLAIATELGLNPKGTASDVAARLAANLHKHDSQIHVVTAGDVAAEYIDLTGGKTYTLGDNSLDVFYRGMRLNITVDYTETLTSRITFLNDILEEGEIVVFKWWKSG